MEPRFEDLLRRLEEVSSQVRELREGIRQSVTIADQDPEMSLTRARKVLEFVVREVYERRVEEPPGTRPLENLLQRLVKDGHLPKRLAAYANGIRELGNVGTHGFGEGVTRDDVYQALNQLLPIMEWYFQSGSPAANSAPAAPVAPVPASVADSCSAPPAPSRPRQNRMLLVFGVIAALVVLAVSVWLFQAGSLVHREPPVTGAQQAQNPPAAQPEGRRASLAPAAPEAVDDIVGTYTVNGGAYGGPRYQGTAQITRLGACYELKWTFKAGSNYTGIGLREGDTLSVAMRSSGDEKYTGIMVYRIQKGGELIGKWTALGLKGDIYTEALVLQK